MIYIYFSTFFCQGTLIRIAWRKPIRILISCGRPAMRMSMTILSLRRMFEMSGAKVSIVFIRLDCHDDDPDNRLAVYTEF